MCQVCCAVMPVKSTLWPRLPTSGGNWAFSVKQSHSKRPQNYFSRREMSRMPSETRGERRPLPRPANFCIILLMDGRHWHHWKLILGLSAASTSINYIVSILKQVISVTGCCASHIPLMLTSRLWCLHVGHVGKLIHRIHVSQEN